MGNHSTAVNYWKTAGAWVVHLDAHDDIGSIGPCASNSDLDTDSDEVSQAETDLFGSSRVGCYDIGNFIGLMGSRGVVSTIVWVLPDWAFRRWKTTTERCSGISTLLSQSTEGVKPSGSDSVWRGTVQVNEAVVNVVICDLQSIPHPPRSTALVLDIDADFLLEPRAGRSDRVWIGPRELLSLLHDIRLFPDVTTIACSLHGGFVELSNQSIAAEIYRISSGDATIRRLWPTVDPTHHEFRDQFPDPVLVATRAYRSFTLGQALFRRQRHQEACSAFSDACDRMPNVASFLHMYASSLSREGKWSTAEALFRRATHIAPRFYQIHNDYGVALLKQGLVSEAISELSTAAMLCPWKSEVHFNLGCARRSEGDVQGGLRCFVRCSEINPIHGPAALQIGSQMSESDPDMARRYLQIAKDFARTELERRFATSELMKLGRGREN